MIYLDDCLSNQMFWCFIEMSEMSFETFLLSTQNICFDKKILKKYFLGYMFSIDKLPFKF